MKTKLDRAETSGIIPNMRQGRRDNHSGCLTRRGEGKPWIARWMYQGKIHTRSTRTTDKSKALKILQQLTRSYCYAERVDVISALEHQLEIERSHVALPELPVDKIWEVYETMQEWGGKTERTKSNYQRMITNLQDWMKRHGCRNASDMTNERALQLCKEMQADVRCGVATYNNRLSQYKLVWATLAKSYNIHADAWDGRKYLAAKESHKRPFTRAEIRQLLDAADDDMRLLILIGAYTGMRKSDCATLKWEDVDMEAHTLRVVPIKTKKHGRKVTLKIAEELYTALVEARKTATGDYVCKSNIGNGFTALLDKCGIKRTETDDKGRQRSVKGFHSLRHFTASALHSMGVSKADIAKVLGDSVEMMDTYIDVDFSLDAA